MVGWVDWGGWVMVVVKEMCISSVCQVTVWGPYVKIIDVYHMVVVVNGEDANNRMYRDMTLAILNRGLYSFTSYVTTAPRQQHVN